MFHAGRLRVTKRMFGRWWWNLVKPCCIYAYNALRICQRELCGTPIIDTETYIGDSRISIVQFKVQGVLQPLFISNSKGTTRLCRQPHARYRHCTCTASAVSACDSLISWVKQDAWTKTLGIPLRSKNSVLPQGTWSNISLGFLLRILWNHTY